jgi:MFS family permease
VRVPSFSVSLLQFSNTLTGFFTYFLSLLGIADYFTVTLALSIVMFISACASFPLIETVGRRKLLLPGTFALTGALLVFGICGCYSTKAATWVFLVAVFVWGAIYQCTLGAVGFAFGAELPVTGSKRCEDGGINYLDVGTFGAADEVVKLLFHASGDCGFDGD